MSVKSTVYIQKEGDWYVANGIKKGVASQGRTIYEALENLSEALLFYYEDSTPDAETSPVFITTLEATV